MTHCRISTVMKNETLHISENIKCFQYFELPVFIDILHLVFLYFIEFFMLLRITFMYEHIPKPRACSPWPLLWKSVKYIQLLAAGSSQIGKK